MKSPSDGRNTDLSLRLYLTTEGDPFFKGAATGKLPILPPMSSTNLTTGEEEEEEEKQEEEEVGEVKRGICQGGLF